MAEDACLHVTVAFSPAPREVLEWSLNLPAGSTVWQALQASGLAQHLPLASLASLAVGVWGRKAPPGQLLRDNDRIEVYRPLVVDPKRARRERFEKQGARAAGLFAKRRKGAKAGY
jgi:uncharacterized protein